LKMVQNGRISDFRGLLTLTLTLDPGMVITFFSSLIEYYLYTKFHQNRRNFLWTEGHRRTHGRRDGNVPPIVLVINTLLNSSRTVNVGWLDGRLTLPFSTKIGYIGDKVLGGDLVLPG